MSNDTNLNPRNARLRVVVVGDLNVDIISLTHGQLQVNSDTPATNRLSVGGSPCNVSAWLSHQGIDHRFFAAVGDDSLGDWVMDQLESRNVPLADVKKFWNERTGSCVVLVSESGDRTMFPDPGANLLLTVTPALQQAIADADVVVMSCYSFFRPETRPLALQVKELCHQNSTRLILDAASSAPIEEAGASQVLEYLNDAWLVVANADEDLALQQENMSDWKASIHNVVIKSGDEGATWYQDGAVLAQVPGVRVIAVDTTGAGDAFMAGLISHVSVEQIDEINADVIHEILTGANQLGALCVTHVGAQPVVEVM